jgi:hypothetical protein
MACDAGQVLAAMNSLERPKSRGGPLEWTIVYFRTNSNTASGAGIREEPDRAGAGLAGDRGEALSVRATNLGDRATSMNRIARVQNWQAAEVKR